MSQKIPSQFVKRLVTLALLAGCLGAVYLIARHPELSALAHVSPNGTAERKVLYWYDAMNPGHHYDKPGKAPDGMDLVAAYDDHSVPEAASRSAKPMSGEPDKDRKVLYWYDPMHPAYRSDKPGTAPDCGMTLAPKYADDGMANMPSGTVNIPEDKQTLAGVRTAVVERKPVVREIRTTAQIVADESRISHVHVKTAGYIDKVFVNYIGQFVRKGEPLFTLYSPDLVSAQEEYLIAKRGSATLGSAPFKDVAQGAQSLLVSARERLTLWDITDDQIRKLDQTGKVERNLTFYSPVTGFVTDRKAFPQSSVTPDTELYTVSDLSSVWATADIYEYEVPFVHLGQHATFTLSYFPGKIYSGTISYIYPTVDPQTRTVKVRVDIPNPEYVLKPQMFADAQLKVNYGIQILVPQEAVLDSGNEKQVFVVHDGSMFEPRVVTVGAAVDGNVAVLSGLKPGDRIVVSGNFLIDSESRMKSSAGGQ